MSGMHLFGRIWLRTGPAAEWQPAEPMFVIHLMIQSMCSGRSDGCDTIDTQLLERVLASCRAIERYLDANVGTAADRLGFLDAEQSLCFGHPLHPTPKSLHGMTNWQQQAYAPELRGAFRLTYFAAHASLVREKSAGEPVSAIVQSLLGGDQPEVYEDERLIPMHPLQADALMLEQPIQALIANGKLRHLGPAGAPFTATSSVRTVFNQTAAWMLKFSLPVRITNSKRVNQRHELESGVAVARLFHKAGIDAFDPRLRFLHDSAYLTLDLPDRAESGFEIIFRQNALQNRANHPTVTVSALTAEPVPGRRSVLEGLILRIAGEGGVCPRKVCETWFSRYLDCAVDPLLKLYDRFGVALEAHQQNSLLDLADGGYPTRFLYRDSQGFYLSNAFQARWRHLVPNIADIHDLFYDDREIRDRFAYYLVVNQIFAIIARMGHDGLADEADLFAMLRQRLAGLAGTLDGPGKLFAKSLIERPTIAAKANLGLRLSGIDELSADGSAIYTQFANPLCAARPAAAPEKLHALAS